MMKTNVILPIIIFLLIVNSVEAQFDTGGSAFLKPNPPNFSINQAFEIESLFPMFFYGGYHIGIGYRYKKIRVRVSIINGGTYDAEPAGISNHSDKFKRYYKPSPGIFCGYNLWKNLDFYGFLENHTFAIEQQATGIKQNIHSIDYGCGLGYQFFIGRYVYIQPAFHIYLRSKKTLQFDNQEYSIPTMDLSPVIRVGVRFWKQFPKSS